MDSLCHFFYKGKMFNGYPQELVTEQGAAKLSIRNFKNGILTRSILMDIPALKGVDYLEQSTGLYGTCAKWLKSRDVAILGCDAASDVMPSGIEGVAQPIHTLVLVAMGMPIFDNVTASPLAVPGATGSALNPIATF